MKLKNIARIMLRPRTFFSVAKVAAAYFGIDAVVDNLAIAQEPLREDMVIERKLGNTYHMDYPWPEDIPKMELPDEGILLISIGYRIKEDANWLNDTAKILANPSDIKAVKAYLEDRVKKDGKNAPTVPVEYNAIYNEAEMARLGQGTPLVNMIGQDVIPQSSDSESRLEPNRQIVVEMYQTGPYGRKVKITRTWIEDALSRYNQKPGSAATTEKDEQKTVTIKNTFTTGIAFDLINGRDVPLGTRDPERMEAIFQEGINADLIYVASLYNAYILHADPSTQMTPLPVDVPLGKLQNINLDALVFGDGIPEKCLLKGGVYVVNCRNKAYVGIKLDSFDENGLNLIHTRPITKGVKGGIVIPNQSLVNLRNVEASGFVFDLVTGEKFALGTTNLEEIGKMLERGVDADFMCSLESGSYYLIGANAETSMIPYPVADNLNELDTLDLGVRLGLFHETTRLERKTYLVKSRNGGYFGVQIKSLDDGCVSFNFEPYNYEKTRSLERTFSSTIVPSSEGVVGKVTLYDVFETGEIADLINGRIVKAARNHIGDIEFKMIDAEGWPGDLIYMYNQGNGYISGHKRNEDSLFKIENPEDLKAIARGEFDGRFRDGSRARNGDFFCLMYRNNTGSAVIRVLRTGVHEIEIEYKPILTPSD